jgi:hypothetical protein
MADRYIRCLFTVRYVVSVTHLRFGKSADVRDLIVHFIRIHSVRSLSSNHGQ